MAKRMLSRTVVFLFFVIMTTVGFMTGCVSVKSAQNSPEQALQQQISKRSKIEHGERVMLDYTCRTHDNQVVDTTLESVAQNTSMEKSRVFQERDRYVPTGLVAGQEQHDPYPNKLKPLKQEILNQLAFAIIGKVIDKDLSLTINAEVPEGMDPNNRFAVVPRVRITPVNRTLAVETYKRNKNKEPELNEIIEIKGEPHAQIIAIGEKELTYKLIFGQLTVDTAWGPAKAVTRGDRIVTTIESKPGMLVRSGGFIGVVTKVTDEKIFVDYGYPFGEPRLKCDVKVTKQEKRDD